MHKIRFMIVPFCTACMLAAALLGCAPAPAVTPAPTQDPATLVAQAVQTLGAQMTADAAMHPSATPAPTETPRPTATAEPTLTPLPSATPTITQTTAPAVAAEFQYAAAYPENKKERVPNELFSLAIGFKNTGTMAWPAGYQLKITGFEGEITVQQNAVLGAGVEPGAKGEFNLWAFGSETLGRHVWYFQMYTAEGIPVPGGFASYGYTSK